MIKPWRMAALGATFELLVAASLAIPTWGADPSPSTGSFSPTGSLGTARVYHTATALPDGRVVVIGGVSGDSEDSVILASTESFDPATGTFSPAGSLIDARIYHTSTLLPDGRVLLVGGWTMPEETETTGHTDPRFIPSAEIRDPASGTSVPTGSLGQVRYDHTATLLRDGRVLVLGGYGWDVTIASPELWDPVTGSFSSTGSPAELRTRHTATPLLDGRVLVIGGNGYGGAYTVLAAAELWGPGSALSACPSASASATRQTSSPPGT